MKTKSTLRPNIKRLTLAAALALAVNLALALPVVQMVRPLSNYTEATNYTASDMLPILKAEGTNLVLRQLPAWNFRKPVLVGQPFNGESANFYGYFTNSNSFAEMTIADGYVTFPGNSGIYFMASILWEPSEAAYDLIPRSGGAEAVFRAFGPSFAFDGPPLIGDPSTHSTVVFEPVATGGVVWRAMLGGTVAYFAVNDGSNPTGNYFFTETGDYGILSGNITFTNKVWPCGFTSKGMFANTDDAWNTFYLHLDNSGNQSWITTP